MSMKINNRIYLKEGGREFTSFLENKGIRVKHYTPDSIDVSTWISIISSGLTLLSILLEFKRRYKEKKKQEVVIINIDKKITLNFNLDSEEIIKQKMEDLNNEPTTPK